MIIAIDFDGTCVKHEYPIVGGKIDNAIETMLHLTGQGHEIILYTMRSGIELNYAEHWFRANGIPLLASQCNPTQSRWTSSPKCYAQMYIDDAALGCPLVRPKDSMDRPWVDWHQVEYILRRDGVLT